MQKERHTAPPFSRASPSSELAPAHPGRTAHLAARILAMHVFAACDAFSDSVKRLSRRHLSVLNC